MSDKFKAIFDEAREAGLPDEWITRFESTFEASPLREENKQTKERMREIAERESKLKDALLATKFQSYGVSISPTALRIPDDLDPTDDEKVEGWLIQSGLAQSKPTTEPETRAVHDRISQASNEGGQPTISLEDLDPSKLTEDEFYEKAAALTAKLRK